MFLYAFNILIILGATSEKLGASFKSSIEILCISSASGDMGTVGFT